MADAKDKSKKKSIAKIERTIEFYVVKQVELNGWKFDIDEFVEKITELDDKDRWSVIPGNNEFLYFWHKPGTYIHGFQIGITRRKVRGGIIDRTNGTLSGFALKPDQESMEYSHMVIFPDGFVGLEYNPHGPRLSQLTDMLAERFPKLGRLRFDPCFSKEIEARLKSIPKLNKLSVKVSDANFPMYAAFEPDLQKSVKRELSSSGADSITITYHAGRKKDANLLNFGLDVFSKLKKMPDPEKAIKELGVKFFGPRTDAVKRTLFNLLKDRIVAVKEIEIEKISEKRLSAESAFTAIRTAYDENKKELEKSVTLE